MKANLYRIKPETGKGTTVRQSCINAARRAKEHNAVAVINIIKMADGNLNVHTGGVEWIEAVGMLEVAKQMLSTP